MKSQQIWLKPWQIKGNTYKSHLPKSKTWRKASKFGAGVEEDWSGIKFYDDPSVGAGRATLKHYMDLGFSLDSI